MSIQLNVNVQTATGSTVTTVGAAPTATADDFIKGSAGNDAVLSGDGNDRVWAGAGNDYVDGGAGNDTLYGEAGNDVLHGGAGNDSVYGGADSDIVYGDDGNDWLFGDNGDDLVFGDNGNDLMWGGAGIDQMNGGAGNDMLNGGAGNDRLTGGAGNDRFEYWLDNSQKSVNFQALFGQDTITDFTAGQDMLDLRTVFERLSDANVDKILAAADALVSDSGIYNSFDLSQFGFTLVKLATGDAMVQQLPTLNGDMLDFQLSASIVNGVKSATITVLNSSNPLDHGMSITLENVGDIKSTDFLRESMKVVHGTAADDTMDHSAGFEGKGAKIYAFAGDDTVTGSARTDWIYAGVGNDKVAGGDGNDNLYGENGNDRLDGGNGNDQIWGGAGNDVLTGGAGNDYLYASVGDDVMSGDAGRDVFILGGNVSVDWTKGTAWFNLDTGAKEITDFVKGEDLMRFADAIPNWSLASANLRQQFVSNWFNDHAHLDGDNLVLSGDNVPGKAGGEWSVTVDHGAAIYQDLMDGVFNYQDYFTFC